ncbi:phage holin family protein [Tessaracoccus sp. OS52]|uniref:phage holin family protein n=1 Tax=Tessaracoccus sp. OS52 TaxID=2886691 RepID=UPI001D10B7CF|nr:phage holin family protein [Tessaracoccus sp. OS52]MCC2594379.1 phage holin family protein [Tessaracoccus sp. OS52]
MDTPDYGNAFQEFRADFAEFVEREKELAKAELVPAARHAGIGGALFGGVGVFAFHAIWMLIIALALAVGWLLDSVTVLGPWGSLTIGFVVTAVVSLLIAFILLKIGQGQFKRVHAPEATIAEAKATMAALADAATGKRAEVGVTVRPVEELPRRSA